MMLKVDGIKYWNGHLTSSTHYHEGTVPVSDSCKEETSPSGGSTGPRRTTGVFCLKMGGFV